MPEIHVTAQREIAAPAERAYRAVADYEQRAQWLPPAFSNLHVEEGGEGQGTVVAYHLKVGSRERDYRIRVSEETPGRKLTERDMNSSLVNRWLVSPTEDGSLVRIETSWEGAGGIGGFFERLFAPRALRSLYEDMLGRLDRYLQEQGSEEPA